jgi:hydrogenase expression/formation protein HypE
LRDTRITLSHGSGGKAMRDLIDAIFLTSFDNPALALLEDQARFDMADLALGGDRLAFTTDSYVVDPLFFPGGDIGKLAVNGTVNDLVMSGARARYLSCGLILEEGLEVDVLRRVARSMGQAARYAGVSIATGDTKVVHRGAADKLFINTAGIGVIPRGVHIGAHRARPGDAIIINGQVGDHGAAILAARGELALESAVESDCQPLGALVEVMLDTCGELHCLRDATRGGMATVLNEFARSSGVCMRIVEAQVPIREEVKGICEILGLDPLYLANEGKLLAVLPKTHADTVLAAMRRHPAGKDSAIIGEVTDAPASRVLLSTRFGGERIVDMLVGEQLPRIC